MLRRIVRQYALAHAWLLTLVVGVCLEIPEPTVSAEQNYRWHSVPPDPNMFARKIAVVLPKPTWVLNQNDAAVAAFLERNRTLSEYHAIRVAQVVAEEADRLGYDPFFFLAMIEVESVFDHRALSHRGAQGLMQLMPDTASWFALRLGWSVADNQLDPADNVRLGMHYFAYLHRKFRNVRLALAAYNQGPNATHRWLASDDGSENGSLLYYATNVQQKHRRWLRTVLF